MPQCFPEWQPGGSSSSASQSPGLHRRGRSGGSRAPPAPLPGHRDGDLPLPHTKARDGSEPGISRVQQEQANPGEKGGKPRERRDPPHAAGGSPIPPQPCFQAPSAPCANHLESGTCSVRGNGGDQKEKCTAQ